MTSSGPPDDHLGEASEPSERDEAAWLFARDDDPAAPAPSAEVLRSYEEMEELLATLPEEEDDGWQAALIAAAQAQGLLDDGAAADAPPAPAVEPATATAAPVADELAHARRRRSRVMAGLAAVVAVAATVAVLISTRPAPEVEGGFQLAILDGATSRGEYTAEASTTRYEASLGQLGSVTLPAHDGTELRVFKGGLPIVRCPGDAGCEASAKRWNVQFEFTEPVTYTVVVVSGLVEAVPADATLADYLRTVQSAKTPTPPTTKTILVH